MQTAGVSGGNLDSKAMRGGIGPRAGERFGAVPLGPGDRPPIPSRAKAELGQKEYRCKVKQYRCIVLHVASQPVATPEGIVNTPEKHVEIVFEPIGVFGSYAVNGYGSYILGTDPNGHVQFEVSTPEGIKKKTANELRADWFNKLLGADGRGDPLEMAKAGMRVGDLWLAEDEDKWFVEKRTAIAREALADPKVRAALGDQFIIETEESTKPAKAAAAK